RAPRACTTAQEVFDVVDERHFRYWYTRCQCPNRTRPGSLKTPLARRLAQAMVDSQRRLAEFAQERFADLTRAPENWNLARRSAPASPARPLVTPGGWRERARADQLAATVLGGFVCDPLAYDFAPTELLRTAIGIALEAFPSQAVWNEAQRGQRTP